MGGASGEGQGLLSRDQLDGLVSELKDAEGVLRRGGVVFIEHVLTFALRTILIDRKGDDRGCSSEGEGSFAGAA